MNPLRESGRTAGRRSAEATREAEASPTADGRWTLRVVSGDASSEEIAAVLAAVAAAVPDADPGAQPRTPTTSTWVSSAWAHRQVRPTFTPGPDAWRTSFWPR